MHRLDILPCKPPISSRVDIAQRENVFAALRPVSHRHRNLSRHHLRSTPGTFMIKKYPADNKKTALPIESDKSVSCELGDPVRRLRTHLCLIRTRPLVISKHL